MGKTTYRRILILVLLISCISLIICLYCGFDKKVPEEVPSFTDSSVEVNQSKTVGKYEVIPCGDSMGITVLTDGVLVLGTAEVTGEDGRISEPAKGLVSAGDYIMQVNGKKITTKEELLSCIENCTLKLLIKRNEVLHEVEVTPVKCSNGEYKLGIWVRSDTQGIGTLTFVTTDGRFGALGHGITDVDTGVLIDAREGAAYEAVVTKITKGIKGNPGELGGIIKSDKDSRIGVITANSAQGVFGKLTSQSKYMNRRAYPVAKKSEIVAGPAKILCQIDGQIREYDINILKVDYNTTKLTKGLVIEITDKDLIAKTGGIVQGMSGSPIIQNGKFAGAVTHVFVNDPTKGYGIFIENMLESTKMIFDKAA